MGKPIPQNRSGASSRPSGVYQGFWLDALGILVFGACGLFFIALSGWLIWNATQYPAHLRAYEQRCLKAAEEWGVDYIWDSAKEAGHQCELTVPAFTSSQPGGAWRLKEAIYILEMVQRSETVVEKAGKGDLKWRCELKTFDDIIMGSRCYILADGSTIDLESYARRLAPTVVESRPK